MNATQLRQALQDAVSGSGAPGATACVGLGDDAPLLDAVGHRALSPAREAATVDTLYDTASLTKVVATTSAVMLLREAGALHLDQRVSEFIPLPHFERLTLRHLLTHTSGMPAWRPFYEEVASLTEGIGRISDNASSAAPDLRRVYSDMGFILLAKVVEHAAQEAFEVFCHRRIFEPLGMKDTLFNPPRELRERCAPTEQCAWRKRLMRGEVHDENAFAMGGISGHAGLFSTAGDLGLFCKALLSGQLLSEETLAEITRIGQIPYYPWQGLGWWVDPWAIGANGYLPARAAFGHTGWTGTSIWMDREKRLYVVLLSNTCHPDKNRRNNTALRRRFHVAAADIFYPRSTNAHTGLDKLLRNEFSELRGKPFALLANQAAVDQMGRPILEMLALDKTLNLRYVYTPEHGLRGQAEAGEHVASENGDVPVISLYGDRKRPVAAELDQVNLFVVDLPDIGARYYTYMATMKDCMAACAAHNTPVLVLDRPNPVGGLILEGPIALRHGSPVCAAPIPVRHGMTLGELALFFQKTEFAGTRLDLTVVSAENWWRDLQAQDCALPWRLPSPNIPTPETALMYVGTCLFEGLNLNEGRGTESPFLVCGAPWLDGEAVLKAVSPEDTPGCELRTALYIPQAIPGKASNPKYKDLLCRGIRFSITDRYSARPFTTAVAVICAIHQRHPELEYASFFDTLAGGPWLREQIQAGRSAGEIEALTAPSLAAFDAARPRLYQTLAERREQKG